MLNNEQNMPLTRIEAAEAALKKLLDADCFSGGRLHVSPNDSDLKAITDVLGVVRFYSHGDIERCLKAKRKELLPPSETKQDDTPPPENRKAKHPAEKKPNKPQVKPKSTIQIKLDPYKFLSLKKTLAPFTLGVIAIAFLSVYYSRKTIACTLLICFSVQALHDWKHNKSNTITLKPKKLTQRKKRTRKHKGNDKKWALQQFNTVFTFCSLFLALSKYADTSASNLNKWNTISTISYFYSLILFIVSRVKGNERYYIAFQACFSAAATIDILSPITSEISNSLLLNQRPCFV